MRTIFTVEDCKNIMEQIFNGNLSAYKKSKGKIAYVNSNSEKMLLIDQETQKQEQVDLAQYLNITFYSWRNRLVECKSRGVGEPLIQYTPYNSWLESLNFSLNEAYALVETIDMEVTNSQDIDNAVITGRITFIIQTNKINNLDYYISKIRNNFLGSPQIIQNSFGEQISAYILIGALVFDEEPSMTQNGETIVVSSNFKISYLSSAQTYNDTKIEISLNGDDLYDDNGNIVNSLGEPTTTKYLQMPITQYTWQHVFGESALPMAKRPDLTGFVSPTVSTVKTLTFYDFNKPLNEAINHLFWRTGSYLIDGKLTTIKDPNIPVFIRVTNGSHFYVFKDMISNMQKQYTNNDFVISSITLKGWGKIENTN